MQQARREWRAVGAATEGDGVGQPLPAPTHPCPEAPAPLSSFIVFVKGADWIWKF